MLALRYVCSAATAAIAVAAQARLAVAQEKADAFACQYVGAPSVEPLEDREGHSLRISQISCLAVAGPLTGGVLTASLIYETDKMNGVLLLGGGVVRKPGATTVYTLTDSKLEPVVADGKVTGVKGSGKGSYVLSVGSAASVAGKSFTYSTKPTGPGLFEIDVKRE